MKPDSVPSCAGRAQGRRPGRRRLRPAAMAVSLAMLAPALAACSSGGGGGNTLTWYLNPDNGTGATIAASCSQGSGGKYNIRIAMLPTSADDQRTELVRRLAAKDSSIDIMSMDPPFVPEAANAGYLTTFPADSALAKRLTDGDLKPAVESATYRGNLVAIPHWSNTQLLWYRKSVAQAAGVDPNAPNFTWDQMIKAASAQHKLVSEQGDKYEGYSVWINALVLSAGGQVVTDTAAGRNATVTIASPAGDAAAKVISDLVHSPAASPTLSTDMEEQARAEFEGSDGGFMLNWPYVYAAAETDIKGGAKPASLLGDIGWARYPQVTAGKASVPPYGGIDLGISRYSKHQDLDLQAVECLTSTENQAKYMAGSGNPAAKAAAYDDPAVQKAFPMASLIRDSLAAAGPRPGSPFYTDISGALQQTWSPPTAVSAPSTPAKSAGLMKQVLHDKALL